MIERRSFGVTPVGEPVEEFVLSTGRGAARIAMAVITYGGIITRLLVPDRAGERADVVLGFGALEPYLAGHPYFGCVAGRVAGRLTGGRFALEGKEYALEINDPPNHLHGGKVGFDKRVWQAEAGDGAAPWVQMTHRSPHGEEGYPGNVDVKVRYTLTPAQEVVVAYEARADQATPLNLTSHSYFNLAGEGSGSVEDHVLQIFADDYAPADASMTLQDRREPVAGQANDFTRPTRVGAAIPGLWQRHGDVYFVRSATPQALAPVAILHDPGSGRVMEMTSTEPCLQLYTGAGLDGTLTGKSGRRYGPHAGLCLECERYPNGANRPDLGDCVLRPGQVYRQTTVHRFGVAPVGAGPER